MRFDNLHGNNGETMKALRPKPGDIYIVLNDGNSSVTYLLPREKVSDFDRQCIVTLIGEFRKLFIEDRTVVKQSESSELKG